MNWFTQLTNGGRQQQQQQPSRPQDGQQQGRPPLPPGGMQPQGQGGTGAPQQDPNDPFGALQIFSRQQQAPAANPNQPPIQQPQGQPAPQPQAPQYDGYLGAWNPQAMQAALGQMDFMQGVNPEAMQRLQSGDWSALNDIVNHAVRGATMRTLQTAHGWVDRGVGAGLDRMRGGLDDYLRDYQIRTENVDDPMLSHPEVAPVFNTIKAFIAQQNPNLSPQEVMKQARSWFDSFGQMQMQNQQQQNQQQQQNAGPAPTNWAQSLGVPMPAQQQAPQGGQQQPGTPGQ